MTPSVPKIVRSSAAIAGLSIGASFQSPERLLYTGQIFYHFFTIRRIYPYSKGIHYGGYGSQRIAPRVNMTPRIFWLTVAFSPHHFLLSVTVPSTLRYR